MRSMLLTYVGLLLLLFLELISSFLPLPRTLRPLLLIPALVMIGLVATRIMRVTEGPQLVRLFAVAGLLWLILLLGLGSLDPLSRVEYALTSTAKTP